MLRRKVKSLARYLPPTMQIPRPQVLTNWQLYFIGNEYRIRSAASMRLSRFSIPLEEHACVRTIEALVKAWGAKIPVLPVCARPTPIPTTVNNDVRRDACMMRSHSNPLDYFRVIPTQVVRD